ncbi:MAG TPA: PilZ domain-containing protein [Myxococcota bacterium]|nr:PilZ domain-containing protein [Myxococcota bacterium]HRY94088.1 PilZ domain-containing protein [Myxococcota bacterium]
MASTELERRVEDRKPLDIYLNKLVGDHPFMVRAADISTTGIYLHKLIEPTLPEGSMVSLEFQLPNSDEVIWARGTVMREAQRWGTEGIGVWFTILPRAFRRIIEGYVAQAA